MEKVSRHGQETCCDTFSKCAINYSIFFHYFFDCSGFVSASHTFEAAALIVMVFVPINGLSMVTPLYTIVIDSGSLALRRLPICRGETRND